MCKNLRIVECVPNFSEGRDMSIIKQIANEIEDVDGISLLNIDPGDATNRTVVTFVGSPEEVVEAAFRAVKKAGKVIDMRKHHGAHPRMGATDVLPLIPEMHLLPAPREPASIEAAQRSCTYHSVNHCVLIIFHQNYSKTRIWTNLNVQKRNPSPFSSRYLHYSVHPTNHFR
ncbi:MAG: hypothetical protein IKG99_00780 [Bacteroidaceae bacterium]|nr:hypothetical protein [Bacteroidaceae bacterium]